MTAVCTLLSGGEEGNELGPAHWKGTATEAHWKPDQKVNRITKGCYSDFQRERKIYKSFFYTINRTFIFNGQFKLDEQWKKKQKILIYLTFISD